MTSWTQAMDGSDAEVNLYEAIEAAGALEGLKDSRAFECGFIRWQHGPIAEVGRNGILFEELLEFVVIPRLQGFNRDRIPDPDMPGATIPNPFRSRETSLSITALEEALLWQKRRTELRRRQGVEGTFQPHRS